MDLFSGKDLERADEIRDADAVDYYEVLQIGPTADIETIRRVYRLMAARFHPDNPETGDVERFLKLKTAYEVLSDPRRRAAYDAQQHEREEQPDPIFELRDFVVGVEGEVNRRMGILALLYNRRRRNSEHPGVSLLDLEKRMAFPREHLEFAMWYLRAKQYITVADNSDYALTAAGADYIETHAPGNPLLNQLLRGESGPATEPGATTRGGAEKRLRRAPLTLEQSTAGPGCGPLT